MYRYVKSSSTQQRAQQENNKYNQPITEKNLSKIITAMRQVTMARITRKGNYLRLVSFEDDYVCYYDISHLIENLSANDVMLVDALDDPEMILDYAKKLGEYFVHVWIDGYYYDEFKREMNRKYGFTGK